MPGKLYKNDLRLSKAYSEGFEAPGGATNPHPTGTPEGNAWIAGAQQCGAGVNCESESCYKGNAANTRNAFCAGGGGGRSVPASDVMASWTKTQLKDWLDDHEIAYASDASKAELQTLAGIN